MNLRIRSNSPAQTLEIGAAIGRFVDGGQVLAISGPLGAGKTQLVKGVALGLNVPADEPVTSPTYVLVREYRGRLTLFHCDAYRLGSADELEHLGLEEMTTAGGVVAIEWADRFAEALPASAIAIEMSHVGPTARDLHFSGSPTKIDRDLLNSLSVFDPQES